jgi:hypothetical protein
MGDAPPHTARRLLAKTDASKRLKIHHSVAKVEFSFCPQGPRHVPEKALWGISCSQSWRPAVFRNHTCNPPQCRPEAPFTIVPLVAPNPLRHGLISESVLCCMLILLEISCSSRLGKLDFSPHVCLRRTSTVRGCPDSILRANLPRGE